MTATVVATALALVVVRPWRAPARSLRAAENHDVVARWRSIVVVGGPLWGAAVGIAALTAPPLAVLVLAWPTVRQWRATRRSRVDQDRAVVQALPDVVDLLVLGVGSGATPRAAIEIAAPWLPEPFGSALRRAVSRSERGEPFGVALAAACRPLGDLTLPLVSLFADVELGSGAVLPGLVRIGDDARRRRRADAHERARRLPVTLLLPLVLCVLPAVALIGIVPLLFASLGEFRFAP
ncbi:MAG: type II secretion system F family protein [Acidimicrobiales bacterium]|nr:type II secretion system F family protein [Acidimicrobiales bacterium]